MPQFIFTTDATATTGKDGVIRTGKCFDLGLFPDKNFSLNETEADVSVSLFTPVALNLEHSPTVLDGKLGAVQRLWRKGRELFAEFYLPTWLHDATEGQPLKISCEWDTTTRGKRLTGCALVLNPRIRDAAISAFSHRQADVDAARFAATCATLRSLNGWTL